jgi:hypothetical protein
MIINNFYWSNEILVADHGHFTVLGWIRHAFVLNFWRLLFYYKDLSLYVWPLLVCWLTKQEIVGASVPYGHISGYRHWLQW